MSQVEAGANVGLNLGPWAPEELAVGARLMFRSRREQGVPTLGADGAVVPTLWRTLVGYSSKARAITFTFGVLAFDGLRARLLANEGIRLLDAAGPEISAAPLRSTKVLLETSGDRFEIVGPQARWLRQDAAAALVEAWRPAVIPPTLPTGPLPWWARLLIMPAGQQMRQQLAWGPVLLAMLDAPGAQVG